MKNLVAFLFSSVGSKYESLQDSPRMKRDRFFCGDYGGAREICMGSEEWSKDHLAMSSLKRQVWCKGDPIVDEVTIEEVNGEAVMRPEPDHYTYFFVTGQGGDGHNCHRRLYLPQQSELIAAGGIRWHAPGNCNKVSSAVFRVPSDVQNVWILEGNSSFKERALAANFSRSGDDWEVEVVPWEKFCALTPKWSGPWVTYEDILEEVHGPYPLPAWFSTS